MKKSKLSIAAAVAMIIFAVYELIWTALNIKSYIAFDLLDDNMIYIVSDVFHIVFAVAAAVSVIANNRIIAVISGVAGILSAFLPIVGNVSYGYITILGLARSATTLISYLALFVTIAVSAKKPAKILAFIVTAFLALSILINWASWASIVYDFIIYGLTLSYIGVLLPSILYDIFSFAAIALFSFHLVSKPGDTRYTSYSSPSYNSAVAPRYSEWVKWD